MHGQCFPRSARLLNAGDYKSVFDDATFRVSSRHALLLARHNETGCSRLGLVIAKKHVRRAVDRNRLKRRAREHFRRHPLSRDCDLVFLARSGLHDLTADKLDALFIETWQKLEKQLCRP